ncbi:WcaI family glycosyltransferase [Acidithiobacillus sp.]|jgi:colanic acid biosynthesis glycosyl transferase WcaI|uniref:WcaI family glycosyltransferase n=1 Tax=Acidithiobacillus sp. TaxID=1872118 RepID=UPI0025C1A4B4|nr:WcaI family glycosyltransferase [Acidithiobacillus sp.]MCK9187962.1 WcaI family glycosyltransferase [Acidithiobacillus sp.]MCK9359921.1 WcaI family glycosyltransferase [Acidithiobacillus sp.]
MKFLIYGLNYAPEPTGTGKYTGEMTEWLAAQGHAVEVVCGLPHYPQWQVAAGYDGFRFHSETLAGVQVHRARHYVPAADRLRTRTRILLETSFTWGAARFWLPRFFLRQKPGVVIAVMPPMQIGIWPLLYSWIRGVPWVLHVQDLQLDAALRLGMLPGGMLGQALYRIEAFLLHHATRVSTISEAMRQRVIEKGVPPERAWLFPNWADIEAVRPGPRANDFRKEFGVDPETVLILYAGGMGEKQGLEVVLEAARRCADEPRLQFLMVGAGGARTRLERQAAAMGLRNLRFAPVQPVERLAEMLAAGDIHLVVQRRDAADLVMPSKLTNILAAGRPCVATADAGTALAEIVAGHTTGLVTPPGDSEALTAAILTLAADQTLRAQCSNHARHYAETHLDRDAILSRFEQQILALIAHRQGMTCSEKG